MGVNSSPKTVTLQRRGCDLNPGPSAPESSTLTTRLPSQPVGGLSKRKKIRGPWARAQCAHWLRRHCVRANGRRVAVSVFHADTDTDRPTVSVLCLSEMTMGQRVTGHGSTNLSGSRGSRVSTRDPLTINKTPRTGYFDV